MLRSVPNSCTSPTSVLNGGQASATSSPIRKTRGSRRISSAIASLTASPYVSSRTVVSGIDILVHLARIRVRRGQRVLHAAVDFRLHVGVDPLEDARIGEPLRREPGGPGLERTPPAPARSRSRHSLAWTSCTSWPSTLSAWIPKARARARISPATVSPQGVYSPYRLFSQT